MANREQLNQTSELQDTVKKLEQKLEDQRIHNEEKAAVMQKTIAETEELAKHLQNTTLALAKERQAAIARAEKERLLNRWLERINSSFDLEEVLTVSIQEIGNYLSVDRCGIALFDHSAICSEFAKPAWERELKKNIFRENQYVKDIVKNKKSLLIDKVKEKFEDEFTAKAKSLLSVPLMHGDVLMGIIYLQSCETQRVWQQKELELLETTAHPLATAIEKARLYHKANERMARQELLNRLTTRIRGSLNLGEILSRTVKELGAAMNVSRCFLFFDGGVTEEYCKNDIEGIGEYTTHLIVDSLVEHKSTFETIVIDKLLTERNLNILSQAETEDLFRSKAKSALAIPLHFQNILHGWLVFHNCKERSWSEDEVSFVESVASQVMVAMTQSGIYEKLNTYQEKLSRELKQAARVQTALIGGDVFDANLETSVFYKAHSNVSGDFYWIAELAPHMVGVLIGDVSGKGPAAALLTGYLLGEFNSAVNNSSLAWFPERMINFLCRSILYQNTSSDFYATAWYGIFNLYTGRVEYANAGHLNPYVIKDSKVFLLDEDSDNGVPLGLLDPKEVGEAYQGRVLDLKPGDKMVLFTDGVLDQKMPGGEFVPKNWMEKELSRVKHKDVKEITYELNEHLNELSGGTPLTDDRLMVCLEQTHFNIFELDTNNHQEIDTLVKQIVKECMSAGMIPERAINLRLGLTEALTNAVRYGVEKNPYGQIKVGYNVMESSFKMSIIDPGPGFNWQKYSYTAIEDVEFENEGGRGIPLLMEIFDKVTWNPSGNQIGLFYYW